MQKMKQTTQIKICLSNYERPYDASSGHKF